MNDRDRLVELYERAKEEYAKLPIVNGSKVDFNYFIADHLIENGATIPVRCGECKYNVANMHIDENDITDYSGIDIVCTYHMSDGFDADDYCSKGKRKDENK